MKKEKFKEQYQEFLVIVKASIIGFTEGGYRIFRNEHVFGYKDPGIYGNSQATWSNDETGSILIDSLYSKYQEYKTFSGWLRATKRNLERL